MTARRLLLAATLVAALFAVPTSALAAPGVQPLCTPSPADCNGWYRTAVTISWVPATGSTLESNCDPHPVTTDAIYEAMCTVTEVATGNGLTYKQLVHLDMTPPTIGAAPARAPDAGGWYRAPVDVVFSGADTGAVQSGFRGCSSTLFAGLDTGAGSVPGTCTDMAGNVAAGAFSLRYDATPPVIKRMVVKRKPDHAGWYNHAVVVRFRAADALSGLAQCPPVLVAGSPASRVRPVVASCSDVAGNVAARTFTLPFDATPPDRPDVSTDTGDRLVRLTLRASADTTRVQIVRRPGRHGARRSRLYRGRPSSFADKHVRNGRGYRYSITAFDAAGNRRSRAVRATPGARLLEPADGASVAAPPLLRWTGVRGARYYNVQLFRGGRKVLSAWPAARRLQLSAAWRFAGRGRTLSPGTYHWFVWPGIGPRADLRYGSRIGGRAFTVPPAL